VACLAAIRQVPPFPPPHPAVRRTPVPRSRAEVVAVSTAGLASPVNNRLAAIRQVPPFPPPWPAIDPCPVHGRQSRRCYQLTPTLRRGRHSRAAANPLHRSRRETIWDCTHSRMLSAAIPVRNAAAFAGNQEQDLLAAQGARPTGCAPGNCGGSGLFDTGGRVVW
jgi:hypothetical protein